MILVLGVKQYNFNTFKVKQIYIICNIIYFNSQQLVDFILVTLMQTENKKKNYLNSHYSVNSKSLSWVSEIVREE